MSDDSGFSGGFDGGSDTGFDSNFDNGADNSYDNGSDSGFDNGFEGGTEDNWGYDSDNGHGESEADYGSEGENNGDAELMHHNPGLALDSTQFFLSSSGGHGAKGGGRSPVRKAGSSGCLLLVALMGISASGLVWAASIIL